jgi:glycosyltransferase involved in cell wall biosynthesis
VAIGCLRGNAISEVEGNGFWGMKLLKLPQAIIANSNSAKRNAISLNLGKDRIFVLPNVIDIPAFDEAYIASSLLSLPFRRESPHVNAVAVGRLISEKRFDRFLRALSKARVTFPDLRGFIVGEGVEREMLERLALDLGLFPDGVCFVGSNYHIPAILNQSDLLVLSSDFEGFPNVLLEAMLARLPVICTPAGDAGIVVQDGLTGFVVPFDDVDGLAASIVKLAKSSQLRKKLGQAGRARVEEFYNVDLLSGLLFPIYEKVACLSRSHRLLNALSSNPGN